MRRRRRTERIWMGVSWAAWMISSREGAMMSHARRGRKPASSRLLAVLPVLQHRHPLAQDPHLVRGGRAPEAVLAPPLDDGGGGAHRGGEASPPVEHAGGPAGAHHA